MAQSRTTTPAPRIRTTDDLEVSGYLERARGKQAARPAPGEPPQPARETIVILDFGSQTSMLIARRIRELDVYCELVPHTATWDQIEALNPKGFILSGGPASVYADNAPRAPAYIYESGLPVLGICYGMQLIVDQLGGRVVPAPAREFGHAVIHRSEPD